MYADLSEYDRVNFLKGVTGQLVQLITLNNTSLLKSLEEGESTSVAYLFDTVKEYMNEYYRTDNLKEQKSITLQDGTIITVPNLLRNYKLRLLSLTNLGIEKEEAKKQITEEIKNVNHRWEKITEDWDNFVKANLNFISSFGISIKKNNTEIDEQNTIEEGDAKNTRDYNKDYLKFDDFRQVSSTIKMMLSTMIDGQLVENKDGNMVLIPIISDTTMLPMTISDPKPFFNRIINTFAGLNNPIAIRNKFNELVQSSPKDDAYTRQLKGQFKTTFDMFLNKDVKDLTKDEMSLRLKFIGALGQQKPEFNRQIINGDSSYMTNELYDSIVKTIVNNALNKTINEMFAKKKQKQAFWLSISNQTISIKKDLLNDTIGDQQSHLYGYRSAFIGYVQQALNNLNFTTDISGYNNDDLAKLADAISSIRTYLTQENVNKQIDKFTTIKNIVKNVVGTQYTRIANVIAANTYDETAPQHANINGEQQSNVIQNNFLSIVLADINNSKTLNEFLNIHPYYKDVYAKNSLLLNQILFDEKGNRTEKVATLSIIGGVEVMNDERNTKETAKLTEVSLYLKRLNGILGKKGLNVLGKDLTGRESIYPISENADGGIEWSFKVGYYFNSLDDVENIGLTARGYLIDEIANALEFKYGNTPKNNDVELNKNNKYRTDRKNGESLVFFNSTQLLDKDTIDSIYGYIDGFEGDLSNADFSATAEGILDFMELDAESLGANYIQFAKDKAEEDYKYLLDNKVISGNKVLTIDSDYWSSLEKQYGTITKENIQETLALAQLNYQTNNFEMFKLFFGSPNFYGDIMKRLKSFMSPALTTFHDYTVNETDQVGEYNRKFNELENTFTEDGETFTIQEEDITYQNYSNEMKFISVGDIYTSNEELNKAVNEVYGRNNAVDAQSLMLLKKVKELFRKSGDVWTDAMEQQMQLDFAYMRQTLSKREANRYIYTDKNLAKRDAELIAPYYNENTNSYEFEALGYVAIVKPIQRGFHSGDYQIPSLIKTSSAPMSFMLVEGTALENIYLDMMKNDVALFTYESSHKVGQAGIGGKITSLFNEDGTIKPLLESGVIESVPMASMQIQVETQGDKRESTISSQALKLATADLYDHGVPKSYKPKIKDKFERYKEWVNLPLSQKLKDENFKLDYEHYNSINNLMTSNYVNMLDDLGAIESEGTFILEDRDKFFNALEKKLTQHSVPLNVLDQINHIRNDKNLPIESIAEYNTIKFMIHAIANKALVHFKVNGGQKIQLASVLLEKGDHNYKVVNVKGKNGKTSQVLTNVGLKFYQEKDTKKRGMEIMLSYRIFSEINEQRQKMGMDPLSQEELLNHLKSNPKILEGVGLRIPAQAMSSLEAFTVKGFLPEYLGDVVAVPAEITTKSGSNFKADKLTIYLNNWGLNNDGLPEYLQPHNSYEKAVNYFEKEYEKKYQVYIGKLMEANHSASELNIFGEEYFSELDADNNESIVSAQKNSKKNKAKCKYVNKRVNKSLQNEYFRTFRNLVLHPNNSQKLLAPNNVDEFTGKGGYLDKLNEIRGETSEEIKAPTDMLSLFYMTKTRNLYVKSKNELATTVVYSASQAMSQKVLGVIQPIVKENSELFNDVNPIKFKHNTVEIEGVNYPTFSAIYKTDGITSITEFLGKYVSGSVDALMNTWLAEIGAYGKSLPVALMAERIGMNTEDITLMLNHPMVLQYNVIKNRSQSVFIKLNYILKEHFANLNSDEDIYAYLINTILGAKYVEFDKNYKKILPEHMRYAGLGSGFFENFLNHVKHSESDKAISTSVLKQYLVLKQYASDMYLNVQASNHESMQYNNNISLEMKEAQEKIAETLSIKAVDFRDDGELQFIPYASALKKYTFVGTFANKIQSFENGLYSEILQNATKQLVEKSVKKLTQNYTQYKFGVFEKIIEKYESIMYSGFIQSSISLDKMKLKAASMKNATDELFAINGMFSEKFTDLLCRRETLSQTRVLKEGLQIFDYIQQVPLDDTGYFYIKVNHKPASSDVFGNNTLYEIMKNLKVFHPDFYYQLLGASILQNGIQFKKDNLNSFAIPSDYACFTKGIKEINVNDVFIEMLHVIQVQNTSKVNGEVLNLNKKSLVDGLINGLNFSEGIEIVQIQSTKENTISEGKNRNEYNRSTIFTNEHLKNYDYISFTKGSGFNRKKYLLEDTGIIITEKKSSLYRTGKTDKIPEKIKFKVYRYIPFKGSSNHFEAKYIDSLNDYKSGFSHNNKTSIKNIATLHKELIQEYSNTHDIDFTKKNIIDSSFRSVVITKKELVTKNTLKTQQKFMESTMQDLPQDERDKVIIDLTKEQLQYLSTYLMGKINRDTGNKITTEDEALDYIDSVINGTDENRRNILFSFAKNCK